MKAIFLNKNNNTEYYIDEPCVLTKCFNETLDSGTIIISNQTSAIDIEPLDVVKLTDDSEVGLFDYRYMLVADVHEMIVCINPKIYKYEITLCSEVKDLEGYLCPSLKITKVWGETRTVWDYLNQYYQDYGPYIRIVDGDTYRWTRKYEFTDEAIAKFDAIECPEMQWNEPNLREVFNDLMMISDCIVTIIRDNGQPKIHFLDLTKTNSISEEAYSGINKIESSRSLEDYISELRMDLVNVTNERSDKTNNNSVAIQFQHFTSEDPIITTQNAIFKTDYPIYNIKHFYMGWNCRIRYTNGGNLREGKFFVFFDLMDVYRDGSVSLVFEEKEWMTKQVIQKKSIFSNIVNLYDYHLYQNYTFHYTRGGNTIIGFGQNINYILWNQSENIFALIQAQLIKECYNQIPPLNVDPGTTPVMIENDALKETRLSNTFFEIEYETLSAATFSASKRNYPSHNRVIRDNQTNSYVNSYNQGFLEYQKANRLGNLQKFINARYYDNDVIDIADELDSDVIYQVQYQLYKNHVEVNALATKNYVLRNYFTGIKAKLRSWKIVDGAEALIRHDLIKYYFEFSFESHVESHGIDGVMVSPTYLLSPLENSNLINPLQYCAVYMVDRNAIRYPEVGSYYAPTLISRLVGDSLVFHFEFQDNYYVGKYIDYSSDNSWADGIIIGEQIGVRPDRRGNQEQYGGVTMQYYRYVDDNGENISGQVRLFSLNQWEKGWSWLSYIGYDPTYNPESIEFLETNLDMPKILETNVSGFKVTAPFNYKKDSQEITSLSIQLEITSDTNDIAFTKEFLRRQEAIRTVDNNHTFTIRYDSSSNYNFRRLPETFTGNSLNCTMSIQTDFIRFVSEAGMTVNEFKNQLKDKVLYIVDENNVVLLAINNPAENATFEELPFIPSAAAFKVYLNLLRDRNKDIYASQQNQTFIKKI